MEEIDDPGVFNKGFAPRWLSIASYSALPRRTIVLLCCANQPSATNNACDTNNSNDDKQEGSTP